MNGNITAVIVKATVVMARFETEKFRSRNSRRGTSGSVRIRDCHQRKMPSRATPSPSSKGTEIGPRITLQSYAWPSWIAKTAQNRPTALSATPTQSKLCAWVASRGTSRAASTKPMIPTGTLMKKIHSQPGPSSRTPPRIGPTSVATPAVAPHSAMALPRRSGAKVRVMTAIVCGVIMAAPSPCTTRAATSIPMLPESSPLRPHHKEAIVKTVSRSDRAASARSGRRGGR